MKTVSVLVIKVLLEIDDKIYTRYLSELSFKGTAGYIDGTLAFGTIDEALKMRITEYDTMYKLYKFSESSIRDMSYVINTSIASVPYHPLTDGKVYFHSEFIDDITQGSLRFDTNCISNSRSPSFSDIDAIEIGGLLWNIYEVDPVNAIYKLLCVDKDLENHIDINTDDDYEDEDYFTVDDIQGALEKVDNLLQKSPDYDKLMWANTPIGANPRKVGLCNYLPFQYGYSILPHDRVYWGVHGDDEHLINIYPGKTKYNMVSPMFDHDLDGTANIVPSISVKLPEPE